MDQTYVIIGTVILGIIGAAIFVLAQPTQTKTRSAGGGMKPRGEPKQRPPMTAWRLAR